MPRILRTHGTEAWKWRKSKAVMTRKRVEQAMRWVTVRESMPVRQEAEPGRMFKAGSLATQGLRLLCED